MVSFAKSADLVGAALLRRCVEAVGGRGEMAGLPAAQERVGKVRNGRGAVGVVFYYSFVDVIALLCLFRGAGDVLGRDVSAVCGDTWVGRAVRTVLAQMNVNTLAFRFRRPGSLFNDTKALLALDGAIAISADGLGETGRVGEGFARLVRARKAWAVPVSVRADRALELNCLKGLIVPRSGARLGVVVGEPVLDEKELGAFVASLELALESVRSIALDLVGNQSVLSRAT